MGFFKGYDVRGLVPQELDEAAAERVGKALGTLLAKRKSKKRKVFLARDNRNHSFRLAESFSKGLLSTGFDVVNLGVVPTPLVQFALATENAAGGCMVTASHNPPEYNGFKMYDRHMPLLSGQMRELERIYHEQKYVRGRKGKHWKHKIIEPYVTDLLQRVKLQKPIRVVFDSGNGTCGPIARVLLELMGCRVHSLFEDVESAFLNHLPDPHQVENLRWLQDEVKRQHAQFGVAFDGDGDRAAFVDDQGNIVRGDDAFILFLRDALKRHPRSTVVYELRCSLVVPEEITRLKGRKVMSKAGRIAVREELEKRGAVLGGEITGHFSFADHYGFDDGLFAAAKMAQLVSVMNHPLSSELKRIPKYPCTSELRLFCADDEKNAVVQGVQTDLKKGFGAAVKTLDGVYLDLGDSWGLVRVSNTEPAITLRFEGKTFAKLKRVYRLFEKPLKTAGVVLPPLSRITTH
ncbi:phosphomannomutase/phosphoglucomutase [Candidatus Micrarchaeota archaeon]|nr:phosphomannomutase/phosphoglucomutase [Candidatus Micrarchaeota archaeon]